MQASIYVANLVYLYSSLLCLPNASLFWPDMHALHLAVLAQLLQFIYPASLIMQS